MLLIFLTKDLNPQSKQALVWPISNPRSGRALKQSLPQWSGQAGQRPTKPTMFYLTYVYLCYSIFVMSYYTILSILCHFMLPIVLETFGTFKRGNSPCLVCRMRSAASVDVGTSVCSTARNPLGTLWQEPSPEFQQAYWYIYIYIYVLMIHGFWLWMKMMKAHVVFQQRMTRARALLCPLHLLHQGKWRSLQLWKRPLLCNWCTDVSIIRTYGYILRMANQISNHRIQMQWTTLMTWHGQSGRRLNKKWSPTKSKPRRQCQEFQIQRPLGSSEARKAWQADLQSRTSSVVGTSCWKEWRMLKDDESWWKYTTFT